MGDRNSGATFSITEEEIGLSTSVLGWVHGTIRSVSSAAFRVAFQTPPGVGRCSKTAIREK